MLGFGLHSHLLAGGLTEGSALKEAKPPHPPSLACFSAHSPVYTNTDFGSRRKAGKEPRANCGFCVVFAVTALMCSRASTALGTDNLSCRNGGSEAQPFTWASWVKGSEQGVRPEVS